MCSAEMRWYGFCCYFDSMRSVCIFFLSVLILSCAGNDKSTSKDSGLVEVGPNKNGIKATSRLSYKLGEIVIVVLENTTDSTAYLFQPNHAAIQKQRDTTWIDLRIIPSPCGAPGAPPSYQPLESYQEIDIHWDQRESWCDGSVADPLNQLRTEEVKSGKYRWVIRTNDSPERNQVDDEVIYLEFSIQ